MKFNLTPQQLKSSEKSVFSQGGQDGVLEAIFNQIGEDDKIFVEFGAKDGVDCSNTGNLRLNKGWNGLLMDKGFNTPFVNNEFITIDNINSLFIKYKIGDFPYLSIDIDGNDYWIWNAIEKKPRVVSIEYNSKFKNDESYAIEYNPDHEWEGDDYYGASLLALKKLGEKKGYTLVYVVDRFDAIFIRNDLIAEDYIIPDIDELLPEPIIAFEKISNKKWVAV